MPDEHLVHRFEVELQIDQTEDKGAILVAEFDAIKGHSVATAEAELTPVFEVEIPARKPLDLAPRECVDCGERYCEIAARRMSQEVLDFGSYGGSQ